MSIQKFDTSSVALPGESKSGGSGVGVVLLLFGVAVAGYFAYQHFTKEDDDK